MLEEFDTVLVPGAVKKAMQAAGASSKDLWQVPRSQLKIMPGFNTRFDTQENRDHIRDLADSMLAVGFKQDRPLGCYVAREDGEDVIYVHAGHCRLAGADLAISEGAVIDKFPVVLSPPGTSIEDLNAELITGNTEHSKPLSPYETAVTLKRQQAFGWSVGRMADHFKYTTRYVSDLLLLMDSPSVVQEMVLNGQVSAAKAVQTLRAEGDKAAESLTQALDKAKAAGKNKVTSKFSPGASYTKALKAAAPDLVHIANAILADPGFKSLEIGTASALQSLLGKLAEVKLQDKSTGETDGQ